MITPMPVTHLSLADYARIMGLSPVHFWGAYGSTVFPLTNACQELWRKYAWQSRDDWIGRYELARSIQDAEREIKSVLGYSVAPEWEEAEYHASWPIHRERYTMQTLTTEWGRIVAPGRRGLTLLSGAEAVTYEDADGDGWYELAVVQLSGDDHVLQEIKVYHAGYEGDPAWEIRPVKRIFTAAGNTLIHLDAWLLIRPELYETLPQGGATDPVLLDDTTPLVSVVDVYREYNDTSRQGILLWENNGGDGYPFTCPACHGDGCELCADVTQTACLTVTDADLGALTPRPADYDAETGRWQMAAHCVGRAYDAVKIWYYAGHRDKRYLSGRSLDPLDPYLAQAIVWLATARLNKPICACGEANERARSYQRDLSMSADNKNYYARFRDMDIFNNPFGTRDGEVRAWQRISYLTGNPSAMSGGAL